MPIIEGQTALTGTVTVTGDVSVVRSSPGSLYGTGSVLSTGPTYIARYSASSYAGSVGDRVGVLPETSGLGPDLLQDLTGRQPEFLRESENGFPYLRFDAERGDFLLSEDLLSASEGLTILILARIRPERISAGGRARKEIGYLFNVGDRHLSLYRDEDSGQTDIQVKSPASFVRYARKVSEPEWRVYAVSFSEPSGQAFFDLQATDPSLDALESFSGGGSGRVGIGYWEVEGRGYLDGDVAEVVVLNARPGYFDLLDAVQDLLASTVNAPVPMMGSVSISGSPASTSFTSATLAVTSNFTARPTADPRDLPGSQAWYCTDSLSGLDNEDTLATWFDLTEDSNLNLAARPDFGLRPIYRTDLNVRPLLLFESAETVVSTSPDRIDLTGGGYTVYALYCGSTRDRISNVLVIENGLYIFLCQSLTDRTKDDLIIRTNPGFVSEREIIFEQVADRGVIIELVIRVSEDIPAYGIEVFLDSVLLTSTSEDPVDADDPIDILIDDVSATPTDPFSTDNERTYAVERAGAIELGGTSNMSFLQLVLFSEALSDGELTLLRSFIGG